jgi:translation initiation factor 1
MVYSTNPDFDDWDDELEPEQETLPPQQQKLIISLDKKQRKGKFDETAARETLSDGLS